MNNKIFFSLALLVAANAFVATPASAYSWQDAQRHVTKALKITGKTAFGIVALGTAVGLPYATYAVTNHPHIKNMESGRVVMQGTIQVGVNQAMSKNVNPYFIDTGTVKTADILPPLYFAVGATSVMSGILGYKALKSAWKDIKSINS